MVFRVAVISQISIASRKKNFSNEKVFLKFKISNNMQKRKTESGSPAAVRRARKNLSPKPKLAGVPAKAKKRAPAKAENAAQSSLLFSGIAGFSVPRVVVVAGVEIIRRKVAKPLIEDLPISLACQRERKAGRFIAAEQVAPGTLVICALAKSVTHHSGIWLGDDTIAELDGNGNYRAISLEHFIHGDEGERWRTGSFAYAACDSNGNALGSEKVAACARTFLGKKTNYTLDANNCHRFSAACHNGGNAENGSRLLETFSIGKLLAHVRALHNLKKISWRPIGGENA